MSRKVSVMSVVWNEGAHIEKLIQSILNQTYKNYEFIIVDDASDDKTLDIIGKYADENKIIVIRNSQNCGIAKSRNKAWEASSGDIVLFIDGDCVATNNLIEEHAKKYTEKIAGVEGVTYYENCITTASSHITQVLEPGKYQTCNISYRHDVWEKVGGFDENLKNYGEDIDFAKKALRNAGDITFSRDCVVIHQKKSERFNNYLSKCKDRASAVHYELRKNKKLVQVAQPSNYIIAVFPLIMVLYHRIISLEDVKAVIYKYIGLFVQRATFWKLSIKENRIIL